MVARDDLPAVTMWPDKKRMLPAEPGPTHLGSELVDDLGSELESWVVRMGMKVCDRDIP